MDFITKSLSISIDESTGVLSSIKNNGNEFIINNNASPLRLGLIRDGEAYSVSPVYDGMSAKGRGYTFTYSVNEFGLKAFLDITSDEDDVRLRVRVENVGEMLLEYVDVPAITLVNGLKADGSGDKLFWPAMEGVLIDDISIRDRTFVSYAPIGDKSKGWEGLYPGACPMQFVAYYTADGDGLYISAHDDSGNVKGIEYFAQGEGIGLEYRLFTNGANPFVTDYDIVLKGFKGDWYEAADIYRDFVQSTKLGDLPKFRENPKYPTWLNDSPIVCIYSVRGVKDTGDMTPNIYYPYLNARPYMQGGYIPFADHFIPPDVDWECFSYYRKQLNDIIDSVTD